MFYMDGPDVYIHRGDSACFDIVFGYVPQDEEDRENTLYMSEIYGINWVPENGTPIRFSVKCDNGRLRPVIQKDYVVWNGFVSIDLLPKDTGCLPFGEYEWDIRLSFENVNIDEWNTPMNPNKFVVCEVVGNQF